MTTSYCEMENSMKNLRDQIKKILKEELENTEPSQKLGSGSVSTSAASKTYRDKAQQTAKQKGVDNKERAIIQQIEANLQKLADVSDIKKGNVFSILTRLNKLIEDQIVKLASAQNKSNQPEDGSEQ